ncbi:MAG: phosphoenolpyruvate synthase [Magnetococcales bacterium]|nr:phosphoenolpyruvate synthase [Magnetococcales bacterium]
MAIIMRHTKKIPPKSDALRANLLETAVEPISIDSRHEPLRVAVANYAGILKNLDRLLRELNHPYRNWRLIMPELRGFVLKNCSRFTNSKNGPDCFLLFTDFFLGALVEVRAEADIRTVLEGLTAYLEKQAQLLKGKQIADYAEAFDSIFLAISALPDSRLLLLSQTHHPLKRTVTLLIKKADKAGKSFPLSAKIVQQLAVRSLNATYEYWLKQADPEWYSVLGTHPCDQISHKVLKEAKEELDQLSQEEASAATLDKLTKLPSFLDIIRHYREAAELLGQGNNGESISSEHLIEGRKLRFLFHIMEIDGLSMIHEETLREINRSLVRLIRLQRSYNEIHEAFITAFSFLKANVVIYPHTALQCIEVLGIEVFRHNNNRLVESFLEQTVRFGFQFSSVTGVDNDWQPICNPAHLYNIRIWLSLITQNPPWSPMLFSALIINLKLTGALIKDTDLFQKEISHLLNSGIKPVYNLAKQFCRQLPVYYNEIGAEGELRTVSTELDEITSRKDRLIHFLRKQCHVESTNRIVDLSFNILEFWKTGDKNVLQGFVSDAILSTVVPSGPYFKFVHEIIDALYEDRDLSYDPLNQPLYMVEEKIKSYTHLPASEGRRVLLMIRLCHQLELKYNLGFRGIRQPLRQAVDDGIPGMEALLQILESGTVGYERLEGLLDAMESLKTTILSEEVFPAREEIYQKRHIAVDIPSVYGCYQERKFDALSLSFRLENLANVDLEGLVGRLPEDFITRAAFFKVFKYLKIFLRALHVDGVTSRKLTHMRDVLERFLELNHFSYHQYLDIFRNFSEGVKNIIHSYYTTHHRDNLSIIVPMIPKDALLKKYAMLKDETDDVISVERIGESFLRDLIAETFGLQAFDRFIGRVLQILARQQEMLPPDRLDQLMTYDPARLFCSLFKPDHRVRNLIHLGNKGFNLIELEEQGLQVPAGVVLTTEFYRCRPVIREYHPATRDFMSRLRQQVAYIEEQTGLGFGSEDKPLLLSVRSGALISMPGMMQTIHNVGLNEKIVEGLVRESGNGFFAWDNYRRFIQSWCMTFELDRGIFTDLMHSAKRRYGVKKKRDLDETQMATLARQYKKIADEHNLEIPDDPWQQLLGAINQVVESWESKKAIEYRGIMDISNAWGTAVVLQRMVYGNIHHQAGSGVFFTSHPHRKLDRVLLWGDYTSGNQGEDIVGGLVSTNPISLEQCGYDGRDPKTSLQHCYPQIYKKILEEAHHLVDVCNWNDQEVEFTFDGPAPENLFFLQSRDMITSKNRQAIFHSFVDSQKLRDSRLIQGIGVSGGALCGKAVFNLNQIEQQRKINEKVPLILIRYDTVPDDIREISLADGLLTARGGQTSHAAIVAARLDKTCVVGCEDLAIHEEEGICKINGNTINCGDKIGIDGNRGLLFEGWHEIETTLLHE